MAVVYVVEDDDSIRELVVYALINNGYEAEGFVCGSAFYERNKQRTCDLVLLDIMLPQESGLHILQSLKHRDSTAHLPVIILTAKTQEVDKIKGLDSGADDYMTKPFSIMELLSRVKAVLRRGMQGTHQEILQFQNIHLDALRHEVHVNEEQILLTLKEFEMLQYFMRHQNFVLSREKIMEVVWGYDFEGESRTIDMHVKTLRQKLGDGKVWLQTIRGVGYKLGN